MSDKLLERHRAATLHILQGGRTTGDNLTIKKIYEYNDQEWKSFKYIWLADDIQRELIEKMKSDKAIIDHYNYATYEGARAKPEDNKIKLEFKQKVEKNYPILFQELEAKKDDRPIKFSILDEFSVKNFIDLFNDKLKEAGLNPIEIEVKVEEKLPKPETIPIGTFHLPKPVPERRGDVLRVKFLKPSEGHDVYEHAITVDDAKIQNKFMDQTYTQDELLSLKFWLQMRPDLVPKFSPAASGSVYGDKKYQWIKYNDFNIIKTRLEEKYRKVYENANQWVGTNGPKMDGENDPIFVQKVNIPSDAKVFLIGDLHSSMTSLLNILTDLYYKKQIFTKGWTLKKNHYLIFLGDIVDRGPYSIELLILIYLLKTFNIDQVLIINGNHEDFEVYRGYGAAEETICQFEPSLCSQWKNQGKKTREFLSTLHYFPSAIYLNYGNTRYQLCHGALANDEWQDKIKNFLADDGKNFLFLDYQMNNGHRASVTDGFKWGDVKNTLGRTDNARGARGNYTSGIDVIQEYNKLLGLSAIISGHQDVSTLTFVGQKNDAKFEIDHFYNDLWTALDIKNEEKMLKNELSYLPGQDFVVVNTSSAYNTKGINARGNVLYDCYLTLFKRFTIVQK